MTAAWAAIWLADNAPCGGCCCWDMPTCDRFEVVVDGNDGSNMPCVAVCLRDSVLCSVDGEPWVTTRGEPGFGREKEKLCRLELLLLA